MLDRRSFMKRAGALTSALLLSGCSGLYEKPTGKKPNVIFMIVDDSEYVEYACYGGKMLTPNIDGIAKDGVLFNNGFTSSSICTPTRYTCLTGKYAGRAESLQKECKTDKWAGFVRWNTDAECGGPNTASVLRDRGYFTGMVGKWHIGESPELLKTWEDTPSPLPENPNAKADIHKPEVAAYIKTLYDAGVESVKKNYGFDVVASLYQANVDDRRTPWLKQCRLDVHNMEWITAGALDFLDTAATQDKPFYLYLATTLQHGPSPIGSLKNGNPLATPQGLLKELPKVQPSRESVLKRVKDAGLSESAAPSLWLDDAVGAIFKKLADVKLEDDTLIFFFSDQQSPGKGTCYDQGVRTPLLMKWPGKIKAGQTNDDLISNIDFAPTIFEACGVQAPRDRVLDGRSFLPLVQGKTMKWRDTLFFELGDMRAVRTKEWKYIANRLMPQQQWQEMTPQEQQEQAFRKTYFKAREQYLKGESLVNSGDDTVDETVKYRYEHAELVELTDQLYHLTDDPREVNNLADNPHYADQLKSMKGLLKNWLSTMPGPYGEFKS